MMRFLLTGILLVLAACSTGRTSRPQSGQTSQYLILAGELESAHQATLYEAIRELRPWWLTRGLNGRIGEGTISVYIDDQIVGTMSALRRIPITAVERVNYTSHMEAQTRYGAINGGRNAISVESVRP